MDQVNNQQDIMSVCLAVVRGILTPEQAKEAILSRSTPEPVQQILHLAPEISQEASDLSSLPPQERDECLDLFKDLYSQPPADVVLREDESFAKQLLQQRLITSGQSEECLNIEKDLIGKGVRPLPRLGELLIKRGFLVPGKVGLKPVEPARVPLQDPHSKPGASRPPAVTFALTELENRYGRYVRTCLLGLGGSGEVWKAWDLELERWVALKFLKFENAQDLARLKREAQTAAGLGHPGIARVYEIVETRDRTFLAMEYIEGRTLDAYPRHDHRKLVALVRDVALAIAYAHSKGVVHRDIKPGNILVDATDRAFVTDFGLARHYESKHSITGLTMGTPSYMAPEQAVGDPTDVRSDVYSIGATLYELLGDRPPFLGKNVFETLDQVVQQEPRALPSIPSDLQTIVTKCLMKEPSLRYPSAAALAEELDRWLQGDAILAHPPSTLYRLRKKAVKWRIVLAVGTSGLLLAVGVAGWVIPRWLRADRGQTLKELELAAEKAERAKAEGARPYLDEGRKLEARLDRLLTTESWTSKDVRALVEQIHAELNRALSICPDLPEALLERGRTFQYDNDRASAEEYYAKAVASSPGSAAAHLQRARLWLDQLEELRHLGREMRVEGTDGKTLSERIHADLIEVKTWSKDPREIQFANGALAFVDADYERASKLLQSYSSLALSDYRAWEWTAHAWLRVPGNEMRAVQAINEALKYRPRLPTLIVFRGTAHLQEARRLSRLGEIERATQLRTLSMEDFNRAREIAPSDIGSHLGLGAACLQTGESHLASAHFTQALNLDPRNVAAMVGRARARLRGLDVPGASADIDEAFRLGSSNSKAYVVRGQVRRSFDDPEDAGSDFARALQLDPQESEAVVGLGDLKRDRGDPQGALVDYGRAISMDHGSADAFHRRGLAQRDLRGTDKALADLTKAVSLDPGNAGIYYDLGVSACDRSDWKEALAMFRKGLARMPSDASAFWLRIWLARVRLGELAAAREELAGFANDFSKSNPDKLSSRIVGLLLGRLSVQSFIEELENVPRDRSRMALGYFYAGERTLLEGDVATAKSLLGRCLKIGPPTSSEASTAGAELRHIDSRDQ